MSNKFKAVPIFFNGVPLHKVYPHASKWEVTKYNFFKGLRWIAIKTGYALAATAILFGVYYYGQVTTPNLTAINQITVVAEKTTAPVMERIFKAESGKHQYGKDGQVLVHVNKNGTIDLGIAQINSIWFATATKLGYDLSKEEDNKKFAIYLYENYGTEPWGASSNNW